MADLYSKFTRKPRRLVDQDDEEDWAEEIRRRRSEAVARDKRTITDGVLSERMAIKREMKKREEQCKK
jgi:hypothetical protein